jgi:hypothetical protein
MTSQQAAKPASQHERADQRAGDLPGSVGLLTPGLVDSCATAFSAEATAAAEIDDSAAALARDLLQQDEIIVLLIRPSLWYVLLSSLGSLGLIALATFALAYMSRLPWAGWNDVQVFALGAGLAALRLGWQIMDWMSRVYVLTDRRIITRGGVLHVAVYQAPLRNIQHTAVFADLRERLFGLGTIGFATAGSDTFDSLWLMVRQPHHVHRTVVEAMRRYGK